MRPVGLPSGPVAGMRRIDQINDDDVGGASCLAAWSEERYPPQSWDRAHTIQYTLAKILMLQGSLRVTVPSVPLPPVRRTFLTAIIHWLRHHLVYPFAICAAYFYLRGSEGHRA